MAAATACAHRGFLVPPGAFASPDSLARVMPAVLRAARTPGAAVAVVEGGRVLWVRGFGWADLTRRRPVTDSTVFQVASISKAVTAWGVLRLVDDRRITLDSAVDPLLRRWHLPPAPYDASLVTVRRILSHTAGLSRNAYQGYRPDTVLPSLEESLAGHNDGVGDVRIVHAPATRMAYSEGGYTLLQLLVEEVTGQPFADYMRHAVLLPLGMGSSSFRWDDRLRTRTATAYDGDQRPLPNYLFTEEAADGLYATAPDLARFLAAFMPGPDGEAAGRGVLSPATVALLTTPAPATHGHWGLGVAVSHAAQGLTTVGHGGTNRGWRATIMGHPDAGIGIVVLTNGDNGDDVTDPLVCAWEAHALPSDGRRCR